MPRDAHFRNQAAALVTLRGKTFFGYQSGPDSRRTSLTNRGEIGKIGIVGETYDNANLNSQIAWLRCRQEMNHRFLFHALNSPVIQAHFQSAKNGAALQQFTIRQIKALAVPLPPKPAQRRIVTSLDVLDEETQRLESLYQQKLAALDELKKSLLHRAFSGEL